MPVSGLVVFLVDEQQLRADTLAAIDREARITMGAEEGNRLAIVLDTASNDEDRQLRDWLGSLPGVLFVEVAFVGFERQASTIPAGQMPLATRHNSKSSREDCAQDGY